MFKHKLRCQYSSTLSKYWENVWKICLLLLLYFFRSLMSMIRTMTRSWTSWSTGASWRRRWRRSCRRGSTIKRSPRRTRRTWRDSENSSTLINSDYCIICKTLQLNCNIYCLIIKWNKMRILLLIVIILLTSITTTINIQYIIVIYEKNVRRKTVSTEQGEICIVKS